MVISKKCLNSDCNDFNDNKKNNFSTCDDCIYLYKYNRFNLWFSKFGISVLILVALLISGILGSTIISWNQRTSALNNSQSGDTVKDTDFGRNSDKSDPKSIGQYKENESTVLRIHGSNTIGAKLMPKIVEDYLIYKGAVGVHRVKGAKPQEESIQFKMSNGDDKIYKVEIHSHGSSTAFKDLKSGDCDLGMASRKITEDEVTSLKSVGLGDLSTPESEITIALDGVAVIVNNQNPINNLTIEQISDIFSGKITDWAQIGANQGKIKVFSRDEKSGTYDTFKSLVLNGKELVKDAERFENSQKLSDKVSEDINAIGFIGFAYIGNSKPVAIAHTGGQPMFPSTFSVSTEEYPLSRRLYIYCPENTKNPYAKELIDYALDEAGQSIINKFDLVSLNIEVEDNYNKPLNGEFQNQDLQQKYNHLNSKAVGRLSLNFMFKSGSYELDNKSTQDMKRLVNFLNRSKYIEYNVVLVGYTDNIGDYNKNIELSIERALCVKRSLTELNNALENRLDVLGMGSESPISSNDTPEGRERNRRVEVYLVKK